VAASKPTSSLSVNIDTFHPLTLNWYFGTLTIVWVVPLSDIKLTPTPQSEAVPDQSNQESAPKAETATETPDPTTAAAVAPEKIEAKSTVVEQKQTQGAAAQ